MCQYEKSQDTFLFVFIKWPYTGLSGICILNDNKKTTLETDNPCETLYGGQQ